MEDINLKKYYLGEKENVDLIDIEIQWRTFKVLLDDFDSFFAQDLNDFNVDTFSDSNKELLIKACKFFCHIQYHCKRNLINWFIRLDCELTNFLILRFIFDYSVSDPIQAVILGSLVDLQWDSEVEYVLNLGLFSLKEFEIVFFMSWENSSNWFFDKLISINFHKNGPEILRKFCYHYFCMLGLWDYWIQFYDYRSYSWWSIEQCIAEMDKPICRYERNHKGSKYYRKDLDDRNPWDLNELFFEMDNKPKLTKLLGDRIAFKNRALVLNNSLINAFEGTLENYVCNDMIMEINEFFWGNMDTEVVDNTPDEDDELEYLRSLNKFSCLNGVKEE